MTDPVLVLDHLSKRFDRTEVLKDITASVGPGEVIGLLGLNGAGKTTLLETTLGFSLPDSGSARVFGQPSIHMDGTAKSRIGFVPQRDELLEGMKTDSYLTLIAGFYPAWNATLVQRLAAEWHVPLDTRINKLSIGQRQKLSIIAALGHEPDLIVLDEPVASLDPVARRQFLKELVDIASAQTRSIVFSTHIVSDLERVASRVWLMQDGRLSLDAGIDDLKENIMRLQLPPGTVLPAVIPAQSQLHARSDAGGGTTVLLRNWQDCSGAAAALPHGTRIDALSLEDLFLELHA